MNDPTLHYKLSLAKQKLQSKKHDFAAPHSSEMWADYINLLQEATELSQTDFWKILDVPYKKGTKYTSQVDRRAVPLELQEHIVATFELGWQNQEFATFNNSNELSSLSEKGRLALITLNNFNPSIDELVQLLKLHRYYKNNS